MRAEPKLVADPAPLRAVLEQEGGSIPVTLSVASRISFGVAFPAGPTPPDRTIFSRVKVELPEGEAELSRCRLHLDEGRPRLIFLDELYDCRQLVEEGKLVKMRAFFQNLPLVLAQKDRIQPAFREFTSRLVYDLSVYKKFFDEQDRILAKEPPDAVLAAHQALIAAEGRGFFRHLDRALEELSSIVRDFDKEAHERHGFYLRRLAWDYILASEFLKRTNLKPRGYSGDAEMMVMLYENEYLGARVFNQLLHKHPIETPAAEAVRCRRKLVAGTLHELRTRLRGESDAPFRFMSVAAGPAFELADIFRSREDFERLRCVLLDQDPAALIRARQTVQQVEVGRGRRMQVEYVNESVRTTLRATNAAARLGRFEFIYSMGLFDYLTPPVARAVLRRMYELLEPGGSLLVGNYHVLNPTRHYMAYLMDWVLYYRSEEEFLALADGLPGATASVRFDPTRSQMFLTVDKQP